LQVFVDGVLVKRIAPYSQSGRLLLVLARAEGHSLDTNRILAEVYPDSQQSPNSLASALHSLVQTLRSQLGWKDSVVKQRGAYGLDQNTKWFVDSDVGIE
jgi:DNA-binding winged helix-turn-helix (wHTH) protein